MIEVSIVRFIKILRQDLSNIFHNPIGTVYTMGDLIQIAADIAQQGIHFSDMRVVYFIYKSI